METLRIEGGHPLRGTITAGGNKNAALKLLPACILTDQPVILHNIPNILGVRNTLLILRDLGVDVEKIDTHSYRIHAVNIDKTRLSREIAGQTRASFVFSGPMLGRLGACWVPVPGGDMIGGRPLDTHVQGLRALGATVEFADGGFAMSAEKLTGAGYYLQAQQSVTATENTIMAAVLAAGTTIIDNAACEPHVQDLCNLLIIMGAKISGVGSNRLTIEGVDKLNGGEFRIGSDFMEVGSFIGAAVVTGGEIRIENASPSSLRMVKLVYNQLGVDFTTDGDAVLVSADQSLVIDRALSGSILEIKPQPWPGFPPDLMSILVIMATQAKGEVLLHDWMYESRFFFVDKLNFMGARTVLCDPHRVMIHGQTQLHANPAGVSSPDIRAGMAMVLAALCAQGTTRIGNIHQLDRGYEDIEQKLRVLGANVERSGA